MIRHTSFVLVTAFIFVSTIGAAKPTLVPTLDRHLDYALTLGEETFDPIEQVISIPSMWEIASESGHDLRLVQFEGPIQETWVDALRDAGIIPVQYIHPFTYITWSDAQSRDDAIALPFVRWSGNFVNGYRVLPKWRTLDQSPIRARALVYTGASIDIALTQFSIAGATRIEHSLLDDRFEVVTFIAPGSAFYELSTIAGVYTIQPEPTDGGLRSEMSNQVNAGNVDAGNIAFPGYQSWLDGIGLGGTGVTIAIVDGGSDENHVDLAGQFGACVGQSCGGGASSTHGTHTAGIVGATGVSGNTDSFGFLRGQGVAPDVTLIEQVYSPTYTQPGGMTLLMTESYRNGAIASSNSWGPAGTPQGYDIDTLEVDIGIRDAEPNEAGNQQFSFVLAFMNGNGGTSTQGSPDEAKNIFTIGSTKMQQSGGTQYVDIDDISSNSAHGPALDGRTIPHMVAPGCSVDSTVPGSYGLLCGTSMACPHVAGAVALFVEQYRNSEGTDPSPAMIKAAFTAAAKDLAGNNDADGGILGHPFDSKQGWGRMDLPSVLINPVGSVRYFDAPVVLNQTGDQWSTTVSPLDPSLPMKIMLVWTDAVGHGLGGSTPAWNNDLDLTVTAGLSLYRGNNFNASGWSTIGGVADGKNNTEGIFLGPIPPDQATIIVRAANLNSDGIPGVGDGIDQDFSVVCYNCAVEPGFSIVIDPSLQTVCVPDAVDYTVTVGQVIGYTTPVTLSATVPSGINATFSANPVVPPAVVTMTVTVDGSTPDGIHLVEVNGLASDGLSHDSAVEVGVSSDIPDPFVLISPLNGAVDVSLSPTFMWEDGGGANSWRFQLSTTSSDAGIIHDVSDLTSSSYDLPLLLDPNGTYYWRVHASNYCGDRVVSWDWSFTTTDALPVLLVDEDDHSPNMRSVYTDLLDAAGVVYEIFDTNNSDNEPDANKLLAFPLFVWFAGHEFGGFAGPGSQGEAALATYLDGGGHLLLSSQDYLYDNGLTSFGVTYLGIGSYTSDVSQSSVVGLGDLFGDLGSVPLSYPFFNWSDRVSPSGQAELVFSGNAGDAGIFLPGAQDGGAIFLGFPIEAMSVANQNALMADVIAWVDSGGPPCPADCNGDGVVNVNDILDIINAWGTAGSCDVNDDGIIDVIDLLAVISSWGVCP